MPQADDIERGALGQLRQFADAYEATEGLPADGMQGLRQILTKHAQVLNGGGCRFPCCSCPHIDCDSRRLN